MPPAPPPSEPPAFLPPPFHSTAANAPDGYDVVAVFGVVRGITVRSRSLVGTPGAVLQGMRGGEVSLPTALCEQTRSRASELAVGHARELGADAVVAPRHDATEVMAGVSEVPCYGAAVRVVARRAAAVPGEGPTA
jgi:uncharacterized protein YbjQ (UPF0145 family)